MADSLCAKKPFVLVVEDDEAILQAMAQYLETEGFRVCTATEGWQAVVQAEGLKIDLVVCDIMMPGPKGTGLDAYRGLRASPLVRPDLPIIFVTALPETKVKTALPADPRLRVLFKPFPLPALRQTIRELTGR